MQDDIVVRKVAYGYPHLDRGEWRKVSSKHRLPVQSVGYQELSLFPDGQYALNNVQRRCTYEDVLDHAHTHEVNRRKIDLVQYPLLMKDLNIYARHNHDDEIA